MWSDEFYGLLQSLLPASTGINKTILDYQAKQYIYNIQGQRLDKIPSQGVYIINGKKYIK